MHKNKSLFLLDMSNGDKDLFLGSMTRTTFLEKLCDSVQSTRSVSEQ
jgi:hypothetical protein